jgi:hypothetical protein
MEQGEFKQERTMNDVQWVKDVEEIKMSKARYGVLVDAIPERGMEAANELAQLFTETCDLDFVALFGRKLTTHDEVRHYFGEVMHRSRGWMWHSFHSPIIEVKGDVATTHWTMLAMSTSRDDPNAEPRISYGYYQDEHVRTPTGWKQSKLSFVNQTRQWQSPYASPPST